MTSTGQGLRDPQRPTVSADATSVGRYRVIASIGSGGMADVFLAVTQSSVGFNKLVVIKRMRPNLAEEDSAHVRMFLDEARLAARLNHPNVVHTYEVGTHDGMLFMVMEYLEGQPLKRILVDASSSTSPIPTDIALRILCDVLGGLHYAHELADFGGESLGVVHRDVSPHNILVTYDGVAKVLDFGIAKASLNSTHTQSGVFKGKANYMAPEQGTGTHVDCRSDVFAVGIVAWELLTGQRLFPGSPMQALHNVVSKPIPLASSVRDDVDPELAAIVAKALERDPDARFQNAEAMRRALESHAHAKGIALTQQAVREFLSKGFQGPREQTRKRIDEEIKSLRASGEVPAVSFDTLASFEAALPAIEIGGSTDSASNRKRGGTGSAPTLAQPSTITGSFQAQPVATRVKILAVFGGFAVAAVALGLWIGSRRPVAEHVAPLPSVIQQPAAAAPAMPLDAAQVQAPAQGSFVTIVSDPSGATVELDGKSMGTTPLGLPLSNPGSRLVFRLSKDGYQPGTIEVTVPGTTDKPAIAALSLKAIPGSHPAPRANNKAADKKADAAPPQAAPEPPPPPPPPPVEAKPASTKPSVVNLDDLAGKPKVKVVE